MKVAGASNLKRTRSPVLCQTILFWCTEEIQRAMTGGGNWLPSCMVCSSSSSSEVTEEKAAGQMQIHSLTTMIYIKQSNAIDRTLCQETRKIHYFLCLFLQKALLGYVIKVVSTEEHRETTAGGGTQTIPCPCCSRAHHRSHQPIKSHLLKPRGTQGHRGRHNPN